MTVLKEGVVGGALNLYFIYKFLRILTTPFKNTEAFELGIIDEKGKILKKKSKLKTIAEKEAYTMMHRLVWKLKRLMEKVPFGKTRLASYAAALWLIKEENEFDGTDNELQESFLSFLETDWENDALILKENYEGDLDKKTFSNLREARKAKLPPHLAKFFDKKGNLKKDAADRVRKGRKQRGAKITDRTPDWMFPEEAPPGWEGTVKAMKKKKGIDNPWALAWHMHNKGMKPHIPEEFMGEDMQTFNEAVSMRDGDKRVVDAFYDKKTIKAHGNSMLTTDGKTLTKTGMGGQDIAKWVNGKIKIVAVSDVKSTEQILRYMKKSIPKLNFEEVEDEAYGGTEKRLKAKKKLKSMGIVSKKNKYSGYVEEVELDEVLNVGRMSDAVLLAFINKFDPDERMGQAAAMQLKAARKEARKRGMKLDEHQGTKPHKHPHEDEEVDEKLVSKLKIKPKKVKKLKDLRLYRGEPAVKKAKGHGSYSKYSDTSGGYSFMKSRSNKSSGYVGAYNSAELDGDQEIKEDKIADKIYDILDKNGIKNPDFRDGHLFVPKKDVKKANQVLKKTGMLKYFDGLIGEEVLEDGTDEIVNQYKNATPGQTEIDEASSKKARNKAADEIEKIADKGGAEAPTLFSLASKLRKGTHSTTGLKLSKQVTSILKANGIKEEVELEEARRYTPTPREVQDYLKWAKTQQGIGPRPVLDIEDVSQWTMEIYKGIKAGWKSVSKSTLGGDENVAIMIKVTVEPEKEWPNKILQNASYGMIRIATDGTMEMFASGHKLKNMRKTKIKTPRDIIKKINTWIKSVSEEVDPHVKVMIKKGDSAKTIKDMHPEITDDELKDLGVKEEKITFKAFITEGRPALDPDYVPPRTQTDAMKAKLLSTQKRLYSAKDIESLARKYKVKLDGPPVGGKSWGGDWEIALKNGINLSYEYGPNSTYIKGWKLDRKAIMNYINKYANEHETPRDYAPMGGKVLVGGFESAFELITEVVGGGWKPGKYKITDEKGKILLVVKGGGKAQKHVDKLMQTGDYDKLTVELVKEEVELDEAAHANSVAGGNVNLDPFKKKRKNAKVKWEMFGGQKVFVVSPERFYDSRLGKSRYDRYEKYVGNDKLGETIRQYGRNNPRNAIILKNSGNGAMLYLKYGRK